MKFIFIFNLWCIILSKVKCTFYLFWTHTKKYIYICNYVWITPTLQVAVRKITALVKSWPMCQRFKKKKKSLFFLYAVVL